MYNDDENNSGTDLNNGAPSSEISDNAQSDPGKIHQDEIQQQMPSDTEPKVNPNPYYEPWQQPVYKEASASGQETYSPGMHSGAFSSYQRNQPNELQPKKKKKNGLSGFAKVVCLVLVCALASGGATYGVIQFSMRDDRQVVLGDGAPADDNTPETSNVIVNAGENGTSTDGTPYYTANATATGAVMLAEDIYSMAVNQVVGVNSEEKTNVFGAPTSGAVSGSGFIISSDGYIVTNYHVISYAVEQGFSLTVMMHDGQSYPARVIGSEPDNDLAVIKIDAAGLNEVAMGNNDSMKVGDSIYAVGNPLGELDYTMTNGIVSALDRVIQVDETTSINMFQIDAAVNPGNSGGPVYNAKGEVIGIVSAKYASSGIEGLGFAIPINDAQAIIDQLITNGYVSGKPSMGITVKDVTKQAAEYYQLVEGAYVYSVASGSSADKAGLKVGDIIIKLGDTDVTSADTLKLAKKKYNAGETTEIVVNRDGEEISLNITFDEEGIIATSSASVPQLPSGALPSVTTAPDRSGS